MGSYYSGIKEVCCKIVEFELEDRYFFACVDVKYFIDDGDGRMRRYIEDVYVRWVREDDKDEGQIVPLTEVLKNAINDEVDELDLP